MIDGVEKRLMIVTRCGSTRCNVEVEAAFCVFSQMEDILGEDIMCRSPNGKPTDTEQET